MTFILSPTGKRKESIYIHIHTHKHTHTHTCICIYTYIYDIIFTPSAIYWWTLKLFLYLGYCEYMICSSLSLDDAPFISSTALSCVYAQSLSHVLFCNIMDCSPPGLSVHGIFQARILEQVAISSSRGSSWPRDRTCLSCISCIGRQILYHCAISLTHLVLHYIFLEGSMSDSSCDSHSSVSDPRKGLSIWFQLGGCSETIPIISSGGGHQMQAGQGKKLFLLQVQLGAFEHC